MQQFAQHKDAIIANLSRLQQALGQVGPQAQQGMAALSRSAQQAGTGAQQAGQQFQQLNTQLNQTNQAFRETTTTISQTTQNFQQFIAVVQQAGQTAQQSGQGAGSAWSAMLQIAGGIGIATSIQAIVGQMAEFARSTVQVGIQMQQLRASLVAITGSLEASQQAFAFIVQTSNATGQSLQTLAGAYRTLSAATRGTALEGADTERLFTGLAQAARAYGLSTEQLGRLLIGFQQIVSKGKVEQEELRQQIGEALPNALQIAARGFGVTTEQLNQMITRGMDATTFVRTFSRQLESELPQGTQQVETLAQAFNRLGNEILLLKDRIAQSGLLQFLTAVAARTADILEATRKAEEQQKAFIEGAARERFGGRQVRPQDFEEMQRLEAQWQRLKDTIEGVYRTLETGNVIQRNVAEHQLRPLLRAFDEVATSIARLQAEAPERQWMQQGIQARRDIESGGEDLLRREQERQRDIEAGESRLRTILERQRAQLETLRITPLLTELERAEERLKIIEQTTKQLRDLMQTMPAAVQQGMVGPLGESSLGAGSPHREMIMRMAVERGIDPQLALALVRQESNFDPTAVSRAGALGLMQLMPGTAQMLQPGITRQQILEPETNVRLGLDYLAQLLKQFGNDVNRALTAYNAGPGRQGIPLPTGENATFARDVLARMPSAGQSTIAEQLRLQQAAEQAVEAQKGDPEARRRVFEQGREDLKRYDDAIKQAEQDQETYQAAIDKVTMALARQEEQAVKTLDNLVSKYQQSKEARDADAVAALMQENTSNALIQAYGAEVLAIIRVREAYNEEVEALRADVVALKQRTEAQREAERTQKQFLQSLEDTNERLRTPRGQGLPIFEQTVEEELQGLEAREQRQTGRPLFVDEEGREQARGLLEQRRQYERLQYAAQLFEQLAGNVGQAWTSALQSIADGTATVSQAFQQMARSILQSLAQIASQEAFKALTQLGLRLILGAATGGLTPAGGGALSGPETGAASSVGAGINPLLFAQHGAEVNRPTFAMLGENPAMNPEYVVNRLQMDQLLSRAPSAGGQAAGGAGISIINVATRAEGEKQAAQQRALGKQTIINEVLQELSQGESSKINRAIRNLSR